MNRKFKLLSGIVGLTLVIAIAMISHSFLGDRASGNLPGLAMQPQTSEIRDFETDGAYSVAQNLTIAPDFIMTNWEGDEIAFSQVGEGPIVLNFWASWCPSCRQEQPHFQAAYAEFGDQIQFVMVNLTDGFRETRESVATYIDQNEYTFPVYFDTLGDGTLNYSVRFIPTTFFINRYGYLVASSQGAMSAESLRLGIEAIEG